MNGKYYRCKQCGNKTLYVEEKGNEAIGKCETCGYTFTKPKKQNPITIFFDTLNKFAGIMMIIMLIGLVLVYSTVDEQISIVKDDINLVYNEQNTKYDDLNDTLNALITKTANVKNDVDTALGKILVLEGDSNTLYGNLNIIKNNLSSIDENITSIWNNIGYLAPQPMINDKVDCNLTATYYNNSYYGILELDIDVDFDVEDVKFLTRYDDTNISLETVSGNVQEFQYANNSYMINWFGKEDTYNAQFNISWNPSDYNTSILSKSGYFNVLTINGEKITLPDIWDVFIE